MNEESPKALNYNNLSNKEITKEVLENLINFNLSSSQIARQLKCNPVYIKRLLKKFKLFKTKIKPIKVKKEKVNKVKIKEEKIKKTEVKALADKGLSIPTIAKELGVKEDQMRYFLSKINLKVKNPKRLPTPITKEDLLKLISLNSSTNEMAKALNCSKCNVRYWLKRFGLKSKKNKGNLRNFEGNVDPIKANNTHKKCSKCKNLFEFNKDNFYVTPSGRIYSWCAGCVEEGAVARRRARKLECLNYLGGKCIVCNYDKYQGALEFHHIDSSIKDFAIADYYYNQFGAERLQQEIAKCIILCANCHRILHFEERKKTKKDSCWCD
jgi:hypothetical protein